jgi:hypothetical protein
MHRDATEKVLKRADRVRLLRDDETDPIEKPLGAILLAGTWQLKLIDTP